MASVLMLTNVRLQMGPLGGRCEDIISSCRLQVLSHFGADPSEYDCVFTSGATAALKLVAECFPWSPDSALVYPYNSHTSVLGMREYAPSAYCVPSSLFHKNPHNEREHDRSPLSCDQDHDGCKEHDRLSEDHAVHYSLLTTPGECNFSGMSAVLPLTN